MLATAGVSTNQTSQPAGPLASCHVELLASNSLLQRKYVNHSAEPRCFVPDAPESIDKGDEDACDEPRFPLTLKGFWFANDPETMRF